MEYIYCKDSEEFKYTMRTLKRMGYENQIKHLPYPRGIDKLGVTIFVSDVWRIIGSLWRYGFAPYQYNCKPSRVVKEIQNHAKETDNISFNRFTKLFKENVENANKAVAKLNSETEPLDDKEELEQDREKLRKFAKDTKGKAKITLAPMQILKDVAEVREYGVKKYGSVDSWKEVPIEDYRDALFRHLLEYIKDPNSVDNESGIKHYKHIACNLAFICEMENMEDGTRSI
jgi:hypothetical protein